jgi:hypothetical protein
MFCDYCANLIDKYTAFVRDYPVDSELWIVCGEDTGKHATDPFRLPIYPWQNKLNDRGAWGMVVYEHGSPVMKFQLWEPTSGLPFQWYSKNDVQALVVNRMRTLASAEKVPQYVLKELAFHGAIVLRHPAIRPMR